MWCTTAGFDGRASIALIHLSVFESRIDREVLVIDDAGCRDRIFLGHVVDGIRLFGELPSIGEFGRSRHFLGIALGGTRGCPLVQDLLFVLRHAAVVGEVAVLRVGQPRRHAALLNDFGNRVGPAGNFSVVCHGERSGLAVAVARSRNACSESARPGCNRSLWRSHRPAGLVR